MSAPEFVTVTSPRGAPSPSIRVSSGLPSNLDPPFTLHAFRNDVLLSSFTCTAWQGETITISGPLPGRPDASLVVGDQLTTWPISYLAPQPGDVLDGVYGIPVRTSPGTVTPVARSGPFAAADGQLFLADATTGGLAVTLPSGDFAPAGASVTVTKVDGSVNAVTVQVDGQSSDVILRVASGTETSFTLTGRADSYTLVYDGAGVWHVTASHLGS